MRRQSSHTVGNPNNRNNLRANNRARPLRVCD
jgi:hypothetical protein